MIISGAVGHHCPRWQHFIWFSPSPRLQFFLDHLARASLKRRAAPPSIELTSYRSAESDVIAVPKAGEASNLVRTSLVRRSGFGENFLALSPFRATTIARRDDRGDSAQGHI